MALKRDFAICTNHSTVNVFPIIVNQNYDIPAGCLVQVMRRYNQKCCIHIRNFMTNFEEKYLSELYEIDYQHLSFVDNELWLYLLAIKYDNERIKFWNDFIGSGLPRDFFNSDQILHIHPSPENKQLTFKCQIKYRGPVPELGFGYYLGIEFVETIPIFELQPFSTKYVNHGIIYSIDNIFYRLAVEKINWQSLTEAIDIRPILILNKKDEEKQRIIEFSDKEINNNETVATENIPKVNIVENVVAEQRYTGAIPKKLDKPPLTPFTNGENYDVQPNDITHDSNMDWGWECNDCRHMNRRKRKCKTCSHFRLEQKTRNQNKTNEVVMKFLQEDSDVAPNAEIITCPLCKVRYEANTAVTLRSCLHSFCRKCLQKVVLQQSENGVVKCPFNGEYNCEFFLEDRELKGIAGEQLFNQFMKNRETAIINKSGNFVECISSKCKGKWIHDPEYTKTICPECKIKFCLLCKTSHSSDECPNLKDSGTKNTSFIVRTINAFFSKMLNFGGDNNNYVKPAKTNNQPFECPWCNVKIPIAGGVILSNCEHPSCVDCLSNALREQAVSFPVGRCPICEKAIENYEILCVAGKQIHDLFVNRQSEDFKRNLGNQNLNIVKCNNRSCNLQFSIDKITNDHIQCPECSRWNCFMCNAIHENMSCEKYHKQLQSQQNDINANSSPKTKSEFTAVVPSIKSIKTNPKPFTCQSCSLQIDANCGVILANCGHASCRDCLQKTFRFQCDQVMEGKCGICETPLNNYELNSVAGKEIIQQNVDNEDYIMVVCNNPSCKSKFPIDKITNEHIKCPECSHWNCFICKAIHENMSCEQYQSHIEFNGNDINMDSPPKVISTSTEQNPNPIILNNDPFDCIWCNRKIEVNCGVVLKNCQHSSCFDCLKNALREQADSYSVGRCQLCGELMENYEIMSVAGEEIHDLFVQNMANQNFNNSVSPDTNVLNATFKFDSSDTVKSSDIYDELKKSDDDILNLNKTETKCHVCSKKLTIFEGIILKECLHDVCRNCLIRVIDSAKEGLVGCPVKIDKKIKCTKSLQSREVRALLGEQKYTAFEKKHLKYIKAKCQNKKCTAEVTYELFAKKNTKVKCKVCNTVFYK